MGKLRIPDKARGFTFIQDSTPTNPQLGNTWYNTSNGKSYVYTELGWMPTRGTTTCWEKNPLWIKIEPANGEITEDGATLDFNVTVKNMDIGYCGQTTFTLSVVDSNGLDFDPSELSATTVTLSPYEEATLTLTVKDKVGEVTGSGRNDVYIVASAAEHPDSQSNSITVTLSGAAAECTPQAPSVSISPAGQTITEAGGVAYYSVTLTNNDPTSCPDTTFAIAVYDSNTTNFLASSISQSLVTVPPGQSVTLTLAVRDNLNDYPGYPVSNNTYVTVSSDVHGTVTSNTVTTTLENAACGWSYGYICGGGFTESSISVIDRFQFPFDSGIAVHVGNLSRGGQGNGGCNSTQYGYVPLSEVDSNGSGNSYIDRFQFPFDSGTAVTYGYCSVSLDNRDTNNSSQHGYVCGGWDITDHFSNIDRFQFPFDSGTASHVGNLSGTRSILSANNSSRYGYVCGGWEDTNRLSTIDRFQFPFDSGTANHVGDLSGNKQSVAANNSSQHGYVCGGYDGTNRLSTIDRFQFPFDSGTASHVGDLSRDNSALAANNSSQYGYACGGSDSSNYFSTIDRFQFPFDSGIASYVGDLSLDRNEAGAIDTTDFLQIF